MGGYKIDKTVHGCVIKKRDERYPERDAWLYVCRVYHGRYTWTSDYAYARHFSREIAKNHVKILKKMDLELETVAI